MTDSSQLTQGGGAKVRRPCQSTIVEEGPVQNYIILTGISEQPDLRKGILNKDFKKHWVDFYHYRMDV